MGLTEYRPPQLWFTVIYSGLLLELVTLVLDGEGPWAALPPMAQDCKDCPCTFVYECMSCATTE